MIAPLLLLALFFARASADDIIPGRLSESRGSGGGIFEIQVRLGTPPKDVRLGGDFSMGTLVLAQSPLAASFSATLTPVGYADMLHIGNAHYVFPLSVDYSAVANTCPQCDGIIGLGGNSPLWLFWRSIKVSVSGVRLEEASVKEGVMCSQPDPIFCNATGTVYGKNVRVLFAMDEPVTRMPYELFRELRDGRNLRDDWPALEITLDGTGPAHRRKIIIPGDQVLRTTFGEPEMLTVRQQQTNSSAIVIGYEALRAMSLHRDFNTGFMRVEHRITQRNLTILQSIFVVIPWAMFFYWKLVKPLFRITPEILGLHPMMVTMHIALDIMTILLPFLFFFQRGTLYALTEDILMTVLLGSVVVVSSAWLALSLVNEILRASEFHGTFGSEFVRLSGAAERLIFKKHFSYDPSAGNIDWRSRLRVARAMIVHQWARDVNLLITLWFIMLAVSPDTLRSVAYVIIFFFMFVIMFGACIGCVPFSTYETSALWLFWILTAVLSFAAVTFIMGLRVVYPMSEIVYNYLDLNQALFISAMFMLLVICTIYVEKGKMRTIELWVQHNAKKKIK